MIRFHDHWDEDEDGAGTDDPDDGDDLDECPRCGLSVDEDSMRCPRCGQPVSPGGAGSTTGQPLWVRVVALILLGIMFYELARHF